MNRAHESRGVSRSDRLSRRVETNLPTLVALHSAHATSVPFENINIQTGQPVLLDVAGLEDKIVTRRRGGYCFEQNTLFQAALRAAGFPVMACEARVRQGMYELRARTHMLLLVRADEREWLCDVGFGGDGPVAPVPTDGTEVMQSMASYRVVRERSEPWPVGIDRGSAVPLCVLQSRENGAWQDLYAFEPLARHAVDFEVANWFTSTAPRSPFVLTLTVQAIRDDERRILRGLTYTVRRSGQVDAREIDRRDLVPLLRQAFDLDLPDDSRFRALDG